MNGEQLKEVRKSLGMTQAEFGAIFGYHQPQIRIAEFELGIRVIPKRVVAGIAYMKTKKGDSPEEAYTRQ